MTSNSKRLLVVTGFLAVAFLGCNFMPQRAAIASPSLQTISIGDSADHVRQALGVTTPLIPANNSSPGSKVLLQLERGLMVFFDASDRVYRIRLNSPFSSAVCGARVGERRQEILDSLGPPKQTLANRAFPERSSYIYECNLAMSVRYDFASNDRLNGIFILTGSIAIPPVVTALATGVAVPPGFEAKRPAGDQPIAEGHQRIATNLQAIGQLAPTHDLGCIPIEKAKPLYTAADLYSATRKCLDREQFELAAQLFALAGAYGRFDIARITDKSIGGGLSILIMNVGDGLNDAQKQGFLAATKTLHDDHLRHSQFCAQVAAIGPPDYLPIYLVSHGLGLPDGRRSDENGLAVDFDRKGTWARMLNDGLLCPFPG